VSLESIDIPDSVEYIGDKAFFGCKSLKRINIPWVIGIDGSAFIGCNALATIVRRPRWIWPGFDTFGPSTLMFLSSTSPDETTSGILYWSQKIEKGAKLGSVPFFASGFMLEICFLKVER